MRVLAPPTEGRANAEAEKVLADLIGARVCLVGGAKSRRKTFEVNLNQDEIEQRLRRAFGEGN